MVCGKGGLIASSADTVTRGANHVGIGYDADTGRVAFYRVHVDGGVTPLRCGGVRAFKYASLPRSVRVFVCGCVHVCVYVCGCALCCVVLSCVVCL